MSREPELQADWALIVGILVKTLEERQRQLGLRFLEIIQERLEQAGPPPPIDPDGWRPPWLRKKEKP